MSLRRHPVRFFFATFLILGVGIAAAAHFGLGWHPLLAWLVASNVVALGLWGFDKQQAKRAGWRVPEAALHWMAFLGATPASFFGMWVFRHKTLKPSFKVLYTLFLCVQIAAGYFVWSGGSVAGG